MAVGVSKRATTYDTCTLTDLDPLINNGNDIPSFLLEKVSTEFLSDCEKLRELVYKHFCDEKDMEFISDLKDSGRTQEAIMKRWKSQFEKIYENNFPGKIKDLLENLINFDDYQLGILLNIISRNFLFCYIVFDVLGIESFIDNLVGQKLILKYGSSEQIKKYVLNKKQKYQIVFGTNEKSCQNSDFLNARCSVKAKGGENSIVLKGHKWMVPQYIYAQEVKKCYIFLVLNEDIKTLNKHEKVSLRNQFSFILFDADQNFEMAIQKIQIHSERFVSYYEMKFNSVALPYNMNQLLLGSDGKGISIITYKINMTQLFYSIALTANTQNTLNHIMHRANSDLEVMLQPPKFTKVLKTDSFKEELSKNYSELKILITYSFMMLFEIKKTEQENGSLHFAVSKLMIPEKCEHIINWAFTIMETKIFLQENDKLLYLKAVIYWFQTVEQSNHYLKHHIGKTRISWFLRVQRGLKSIKKGDTIFAKNEKENNFLSESNKVPSNGDLLYNFDTSTSFFNLFSKPSNRNSSILLKDGTENTRRPLTP